MFKQSVLIYYVTFSLYFSLLKSPSRKDYKTGFSVLTTTELSLQVELTDSCNGLRAFHFIDLATGTNHELRASSNQLWASSYEL
jgi:hypothetical protein